MAGAGAGGIRIDRLVDRMAAARPDGLALIYGERRWTYRQLLVEMERRAAALRAAGLRPGEIVGTTEPIGDDLLITALACCRADLPLLYLSPRLANAEVRPLLLRSDARLLLTAAARPHPAQPETRTLALALPGGAAPTAALACTDEPSPGDADRPAFLQSSSGTTGGRLKLVLQSHRQLTWRYALLSWWETAEQIHYSPLAAQLPLRALCTTLASGATLVQAATTDFRQMEAEMVRHRVTVLRAPPRSCTASSRSRRRPPVSSRSRSSAAARRRSRRSSSGW